MVSLSKTNEFKKSWKRTNVRLEEIHSKEGSSDVFEPFSLLPMFFAKCLYSFIDDLTQNLFKITAQECEKSTSGPVDVRGSKRRCLSFLITMQERERVNERERKCSSWDT